MDKLLEKAWELFAEYLTFFILFLRSPVITMELYADKKAIDKNLISFVAASLGLCWLMVLTIPLFIPDEAKPVILARWRYDAGALIVLEKAPALIPPLFIVATVFGSMLVHIPLLVHRGNLWDTINAGVGTAATCVPIFMLNLLVYELLPLYRTHLALHIFLVCLTLAMPLVIVAYGCAAQAGTHLDRKIPGTIFAWLFLFAIIGGFIRPFTQHYSLWQFFFGEHAGPAVQAWVNRLMEWIKGLLHSR